MRQIYVATVGSASSNAKLGEAFLPDPRSSNGRTAAFGAVNRGSNPCRGAKNSKFELTPVLLTLLAGAVLFQEQVAEPLLEAIDRFQDRMRCQIGCLNRRIPVSKF